MKDIPMFTTPYGTAGLILREVPYQEEAYVRLQEVTDLQGLIKECLDFCKAVGAQRVYATGYRGLEAYPLSTAIVSMVCQKDSLGETDAALWPVQENTAAEFQRIYNEKIFHVPNGAWMDQADIQEMLKRGDGYFVHRGDTLLGIGRVYDGCILWLAAVQKGAGADVVKALATALHTDTVKLDVATANQKANKLYLQLGFLSVEEKSRWYQIL